MLFAAKNDVRLSAAVLIGFVAAAVIAQMVLNLRWHLLPYPSLPWHLGFGLGVLLAADGMLHAVLWLLFGKGYLAAYEDLIAYFDPQERADILTSGLAAGIGEELLLRGALLTWLITRAGVQEAVATVLAAAAGGLLYLLPDRRLAPFALWVVLQGLMLGMIYVATGSLLVTVLIRAAHDMIGFSLFAYQRRTGWLLGPSQPVQRRYD
jgi:membrane protease YdiL (CAAX protease family)